MLTPVKLPLKSVGPNDDKTRSDVGAVAPTTDALTGAFTIEQG